MPEYRFKGGSRIEGITPQVAGEELNKLLDEEGMLQAADVVEAARPLDAPLHPAFEWDDSIAAEQFRKGQARQLIRAICIAPHKGEKPQRIFVNVSTPGGRKYAQMSVVVQSQSLFDSARADAIIRLRNAERSLEELHQAISGDDKASLAAAGRAKELVGEAREVLNGGKT
jgi:hypothetical protein